MIKQAIKRTLQAIAPRWTTGLLSARSRAHSHLVVSNWGCGVITEKLVLRFGSQVQEGPFSGMMLSRATHAEHLGPFLLGIYESELDSAWAEVFKREYSQIVDIGAKFGYYAVGLARKYPGTPVVAFDTDWWARAATNEMSAANHVENIEILSYCDRTWLERYLKDQALIVCDCEGFESVLFTAPLPAAIRTCVLIIETHDAIIPGVTSRLILALSETHQVTTFVSGVGRRQTTRSLEFLNDHEAKLAVSEPRHDSEWLFCVPRV